MIDQLIDAAALWKHLVALTIACAVVTAVMDAHEEHRLLRMVAAAVIGALRGGLFAIAFVMVIAGFVAGASFLFS